MSNPLLPLSVDADGLYVSEGTFSGNVPIRYDRQGRLRLLGAHIVKDGYPDLWIEDAAPGLSALCLAARTADLHLVPEHLQRMIRYPDNRIWMLPDSLYEYVIFGAWRITVGGFLSVDAPVAVYQSDDVDDHTFVVMPLS